MSGEIRIEPNRKFQMGEQILRFRKVVRGHERPYIFEDETGYPLAMSGEEIRRARDANELRDWMPSSTAIVRADKVIHRSRITLDSALESEREEFERKMEYVLAWQARPGTPRSPRGLLPIIQEVHQRQSDEAERNGLGKPRTYSVSSVQKFIQRFHHPDLLVPQTRRRGNHRQRLVTAVQDIILVKIDDRYLTLNGPDVAGLHAEIRDEVEERNKAMRRKNGQHVLQLAIPSYEAVRAAVNRLCRYTVAFCREGKQVADAEFRLVGNGIVTERANEVWEVDDTRVDMMCTLEDGETVIGRPWLILVIDRHTRMIMSFVLTFSPHDTESALEAVRRAILGMQRLLKHHPGFRDCPAEGRPDAIHVDNGKQYNSKAFKRGVTRLGIQHKTLPVLKPWYKGTIERLIGTVMCQVFHTVPGTTYANIFERDRETPPELVAKTTLAQADRKLLAWVVNEYQHRHHRGIETTPYRMWQASVRSHPLRMPFTRQQVDTALSLTADCKLRRGGFVLDGLRYLTAEGLRMEMSPAMRSSTDVIVRREPGDLTVVHILDPGISDRAEEVWHLARICSQHYPLVVGKPLVEYKLAKAMRLNNPELLNDDADWSRTYELVGDKEEQQAEDHRLTERTRAEGSRERRLTQALHRVADQPGTLPEPAPGGDIQARLEALDDTPPADLPTGGDGGTEQADDLFEKLRSDRTISSRRRTPKED